jgi:hypothetical protein
LMKPELKILKNLLNFSVVVELHLLNWVLLVFFYLSGFEILVND